MSWNTVLWGESLKRFLRSIQSIQSDLPTKLQSSGDQGDKQGACGSV